MDVVCWLLAHRYTVVDEYESEHCIAGKWKNGATEKRGPCSRTLDTRILYVSHGRNFDERYGRKGYGREKWIDWGRSAENIEKTLSGLMDNLISRAPSILLIDNLDLIASSQEEESRIIPVERVFTGEWKGLLCTYDLHSLMREPSSVKNEIDFGRIVFRIRPKIKDHFSSVASSLLSSWSSCDLFISSSHFNSFFSYWKWTKILPSDREHRDT